MAGVHAFIGSWREEEKEGFEAMAEALGLPPEKKAFFKNAKTEISYAQDGEFWTITVGMQGVPDNRTFRFKLGDPYDSASLDGSKMKSVMVAEKDTFVEKHTDESMNMEMHIVRHIENDKMIVPGRLKHVQAIGWYLEEANMAQVSVNITDFEETAIHTVYEEVCKDAETSFVWKQMCQHGR